MSAVVDINSGLVAPSARIPYEPLIALLKELLEKAECGEIQGAAVAYVFADGDTTYQISSRQTSFGLVGAVETAKHELFKHDHG